ncbi:hypothetical protein ACXZ65_28085 [Streptomyces aculeolatus]
MAGVDLLAGRGIQCGGEGLKEAAAAASDREDSRADPPAACEQDKHILYRHTGQGEERAQEREGNDACDVRGTHGRAALTVGPIGTAVERLCGTRTDSGHAGYLPQVGDRSASSTPIGRTVNVLLAANPGCRVGS